MKRLEALPAYFRKMDWWSPKQALLPFLKQKTFRKERNAQYDLKTATASWHSGEESTYGDCQMYKLP